MDVPKYFHQLEDHAVFRPTGVLRLAQMGEMVTDAIAYARETGERRLMVVLTEVTGYPPPKLTARYRIVREWARASAGKVRVAMVSRVEMIDPNRFGVTVATNAGMVSNVFVDEREALEWLMGEGFNSQMPHL